MKFKKEHTVDFMIERASNEADGYFELTFGSPRETPRSEALSVKVTPLVTSLYQRTPRKHVTWRRGDVVITRSAAATQLQTWREKRLKETTP